MPDKNLLELEQLISQTSIDEEIIKKYDWFQGEIIRFVFSNFELKILEECQDWIGEK